MIEVQGLRKEYGDLIAVDGIDFTAESGSIFGLLGPNGAGKSTTIGCISGLISPTAGRVRVDGHDVVRQSRQAKARLGVVPQEIALYEDLPARHNVSYWGAAYGLRGQELQQRVTEVLELVGLLDRADDNVEEFSGGMKRRLNFGCGIVHRPRVLLLDEPTVGVDPQSRVRLQELVRQQADEGACVLYTTHYMEEAETLCDRLAIIDHGSLLATGTLEELRSMMAERDVIKLQGRFDGDRAADELRQIEGLDVVGAQEDALLLSVVDGSRKLPRIFAAVEDAGGEIQETKLTQPSLESLFIKLTGRELRE